MKSNNMLKIMCVTLLLATAGCMTSSSGKKGGITPKPLKFPKAPKSTQIRVTEENDRLLASNETVKSRTVSTKLLAESITDKVDSLKTAEPEKVTSGLDSIGNDAQAIYDNSEQVLQASDDINKVIEELAKVDLELLAVERYVEEVKKSNDEAAKANEELEEEVGDLNEELDEAKKGVTARNQTLWMYVVGFSSLLLVAGVFVFIFVDKKLGGGAIVAALILAPIAYFMAKFAWLVAIAGGVIFLAICGGIVRLFYTHRKALVESITSLEISKGKDWKDVKETVKSVQSNTTSALVDEIRTTEKVKITSTTDPE